eukprot:PhM_4_TR1408/c0_g1_i1/m.70309/K13766/liuC; methylglutaconyl-CoA hydratase
MEQTTDEKALLVSVSSDGVGTITLNRPKQGNSMTPAMLSDMTNALASFARDPTVRVAVLTANGKYFCTGMDLSGGTNKSALKPLEAFESVFNFPKPLVLRMNGPALGGGVGLMFCTDIRVVTEDCFISFPEVGVGIYPAVISGYITPQLGPYLTSSLMLSSAPFTAKEMLQARVVSRVAKDLDREVNSVVQQLLSNSSHGMAGVKRLVRTVGYGGNFRREVMADLAGEFAVMVRHPEAKFAMGHFKQYKKKPDWKVFYADKKSTKSKLW